MALLSRSLSSETLPRTRSLNLRGWLCFMGGAASIGVPGHVFTKACYFDFETCSACISMIRNYFPCTPIHMYMCRYICSCIRIYTYRCIYLCTCRYIHMHVHKQNGMFKCFYAYTCKCVHLHMYTGICMEVYMLYSPDFCLLDLMYVIWGGTCLNASLDRSLLKLTLTALEY